MATIIPLKTASIRHSEALDELTALVADDLAAVNQIIVQRMESDVPLIPELAHHVIAAGGKRLRPVLALAATRLCGYEGERHRKLAAAIEFIHTATLLHDDVIDSSDLRRGRPSANALFGNQSSILVGDFLFSRSFQLMVEDGSIDVLRILSSASAVISEGEVLQLSAQHDCAVSEQTYLEIVRAKTAELFAAACRVGSVIAARPMAEEEALRTFGLNLGVAFQIIDDVLDYRASQTDFGKTIGDDFKEGKITLPVILAMHRGDEAERAFWGRTLGDVNQKNGDFTHALDILKRHNALQDSVERARHYGAIARDALGVFPDSDMKRALLNCVDFTIERGY